MRYRVSVRRDDQPGRPWEVLVQTKSKKEAIGAAEISYSNGIQVRVRDTKTGQIILELGTMNAGC